MTSKWGCRVRFKTGAASVAAFLVSATPLAAQDISINFGQGAASGGLNERIIQPTALMTVLSLALSILIMMTSFIPLRRSTARLFKIAHFDRPANSSRDGRCRRDSREIRELPFNRGVSCRSVAPSC